MMEILESLRLAAPRGCVTFGSSQRAPAGGIVTSPASPPSRGSQQRAFLQDLYDQCGFWCDDFEFDVDFDVNWGVNLDVDLGVDFDVDFFKKRILTKIITVNSKSRKTSPKTSPKTKYSPGCSLPCPDQLLGPCLGPSWWQVAQPQSSLECAPLPNVQELDVGGGQLCRGRHCTTCASPAQNPELKKHQKFKEEQLDDAGQ